MVAVKPKSYNRKKKSLEFGNRVVAAFSENYPTHKVVGTELYGLVYHFFRKDIGIDADNLSKPVWDCLKGILFGDDKQVKMRIAGSFDLISNDFTVLDLSSLSKKMAIHLLEAFETEDHVLYIECGTFTVEMVRLNLEKNEY